VGGHTQTCGHGDVYLQLDRCRHRSPSSSLIR